uniref:Uncharacterized protein n=1 Tax=Rhizophora mucronata TaxID=61149 RepID=A0A2P2L0T2_RHIMU
MFRETDFLVPMSLAKRENLKTASETRSITLLFYPNPFMM